MAEDTLVLEKGVKETDIDVIVDDEVYCMQDKYELPYTTVDDVGNTTVSVVEKVDLLPDPAFPERDFMQARLHVKVFKNTTIGVTPVPATTATETCPRRREFLSATVNSLEHNMGTDRYMRTIYNTLARDYNKIGTYSTTSPITSLKYTAYNDDADMITSSATTYLRPYLCNTATTNSATTYVKWTFEKDGTYSHHIKYWYGKEKAHPVIDAVERMREILRTRQSPAVIVRRTSLQRTTDIREIRARQTLRRLIGEVAYQKYSARGFITFKGDSGRTYQIFPGHGKVAVWQQGKQIEQLCVVLTGDFPPTDSVIMRLLLIQESEDRFKKIANVFPSYAPGLNRACHIEVANQPLSLPEIFSDLKNQQKKSLKLLVA